MQVRPCSGITLSAQVCEHLNDGMVRFVSTRGQSPAVTFAEAVTSSYAPDGGLYVPISMPKIGLDTLKRWQGLDFPHVCAAVLAMFTQYEVTEGELLDITQSAFGKSSDQDEVLFPIVKLDEKLSVFETFNGPTGSFKVSSRSRSSRRNALQRYTLSCPSISPKVLQRVLGVWVLPDSPTSSANWKATYSNVPRRVS
eukprot:4957741-Pyramimonas_sp.AAC.1